MEIVRRKILHKPIHRNSNKNGERGRRKKKWYNTQSNHIWEKKKKIVRRKGKICYNLNNMKKEGELRANKNFHISMKTNMKEEENMSVTVRVMLMR